MQLVLITRDVKSGVHSSHARLAMVCACIHVCVGLVGFKFEVRMMNAVWRTPPGTCCDRASHSRSKFLILRMASSECISEKPTQDDIPGTSLNEPFHGILKVRTFTNRRQMDRMVYSRKQ